ncbi:MAG: hypothetical protein R3F56_17860 [Planctomycetota bacterium]
MTAHRTRSVERPWVHASRLDPDTLTRPLAEVRLPPRVRRACASLGLHTVADVLGLDEETFVAQRGVGRRSWQRLVVAVRRSLFELTGLAPGQAQQAQHMPAFAQPTTQRALRRLGSPDAGMLLRAVRDAVLALPGVAEDEYERLASQGAAHPRPAAPTAPGSRLWPAALADRSLHELNLRTELADRLNEFGLRTLGDALSVDPTALAADPAVAESGVDELRAALGVFFAPVLTDRRSESAGGSLARLLAALAEEDRALVTAALGLAGERPVTRPHLARLYGLTLDGLETREERCRNSVRSRCPDLLQTWRQAAEAELAAQDGVVRSERIAQGPLRELAAAGDPGLPLRVLAFFFARELYLVGDVVTTVDAGTCRRIGSALARLRHTLPRPLAAIEADLADAGLPTIRRGLLQWLVQQDSHLQVVIDPLLSEVLRRRRATVGDRIEQVLRSAGRALSLAELLFRYRDRHRRARRSRLLDNLWAEPRFVEVGPGTWDLRERHVDQAELIEAEAVRVRDIICTVGGRHDVADLIEGGESSDRVLFLLRDCLRRDPSLRSLGRGEFCPRSMRMSTQIEALQHALRAAMGELPLERFLANQHRASRELRTRLLRENHLFVEVAPDRIDLLTNYPYTGERLRTLLRTVELHLEQHDGFDRLTGALAAVEEAGLGGRFLSEHMLSDILRRHSRFEMLSGDLVALRSRGLRSWIQQRSRDAIRRASQGLTASQIQAEIPELAQFATCLETLIADDPMVQSADGMHYRVV